MSSVHQHALLIVLFVGAIAPLFNELPIRLRLPLVVLELLFGVVIGPQVLDLVASEGVLKSLSALGLSFLFFLAGMDLDFAKLRGRPLQLGVTGWFFSITAALGFTFSLQAVGLVSDPVLVAIALSTTAIGTLLPILREAGELDTALGRFVMGAGAIGEFGPIVLFSLVITDQGVAVHSELLVTFVVISLACATIALRLRPPHLIAVLARTMQSTSQLPVRLSILLLGALVVLADALGLDILLGAFAAGSLVGLVARGPGAEPFRQKLDALGFGFLIPIFFVTSGAQLDLSALLASPTSIARVPLFLVLLLVVRGVPALLLYRRDLSGPEQRMLALLSATTLPLVVVITEIGKSTGRMLPENAAALVGAGILSVLLFPLIELSLRGKG